VPNLLYRGLVHINVALIQTSPPDDHGFMSLGVSVDIVKAAAEQLGGTGGGGRPDMAQAGGTDATNAEAAIRAAEAVIGA